MADDNGSDEAADGEDDPAVELGDHPPVEGAPAARVASRLTWPLEKSKVRERQGDATIRTPDGPRELADVLAAVDVTYFDSRQTFLESIREAVGIGPVPTEE